MYEIFDFQENISYICKVKERQKEAGAQHPEADLNSDKTNTNYLQTFLKRQSV